MMCCTGHCIFEALCFGVLSTQHAGLKKHFETNMCVKCLMNTFKLAFATLRT